MVDIDTSGGYGYGWLWQKKLDYLAQPSLKERQWIGQGVHRIAHKRLRDNVP